jgi:hypothetical protein
MADHPAKLSIAYPGTWNRGTLILRALFGMIYVMIPHMFCLWFYAIAVSFVSFIGFWIILFTGKYPENMFNFVVGYYRWTWRVNAYMLMLTDEYPPFSGQE